MKNQALTTTLAILLAVSLSAIVALVVSSEVIGAQQFNADTPAAIEIDVVSPDPATQEPALNPAPAEEASSPDPVPEAPATDPTTDDGDTDDGDTDDGDTDDGDTDDGDTDDGDTDDDETVPVDPPCEGTVIDGECVPPISILCPLGYELVDDTCGFVGCPFGYLLNDSGVCEQLVFVAPCEEGFFRVNGECVPNLVIDPGVLVPLCLVGEHVEDGACVPDPKFDPNFFNPNLELAFDG